jgi:hypothetical protein
MEEQRPMTHVTRRGFIKAIGVSCCALDCFSADVFAEIPASAKLSEAADRGRRFLEMLFDPELELLPEYRGAEVYWLFHDNYLAAKVLADTNQRLADKIKAAIQGFAVDHSGKIEILFGEARQPLPFRQYELTEVRRVKSKIVKTEIVKDTILKGWEDYADLLFMAAMAETDPQKARGRMDEGLRMWDGTGFNDRATETLRRYAAYKLALSLIAATRLKVTPDQRAVILGQLLSQQNKDGGWITDYDAERKPVGLANVETTCLAILALEAVAKAE